MKLRLAPLLLAIALACDGDSAPSTIFVPPRDAPDATNCSPSDEVWDDIQDRLSRDDFVKDDTLAIWLTAPTQGQVVPADPPLTFTWMDPQVPAPRHLCGNGKFVVLHVDGVDPPLDVIGGCTNDGCAPFPSWTPDAETWKRFQDAPGDITVTLTTAPYERYAANGELARRQDPNMSTTFRVAP